MTITISSDFGFTLSAIAAIAIQCIFTGFIAGGSRKKIFSKEYMERNFGEQHKKAFGENIKPMGYPDMGNGVYSSKLEYKDWYNFNNSQRAHYNFVEQVGSVIALVFVAGIGMPWVAGILGWLYCIGRLIYTMGYVAKGPNGRLIGAGVMDLGLLGLIGVAGYSCYKVIMS